MAPQSAVGPCAERHSREILLIIVILVLLGHI